MPRVFARRAALVAAALGVLSLLPDRALAVDHLLITEFANTPTAGEFVEIFNPTGDTILLDDFYLTDMVFYGNATGTPPFDNPGNYWHLADGSLSTDGFDFCVKFPDGTTMTPGQTLVVSISDGAGCSASWGGAPVDFQLPRGTPPSVTEMVDAGLLHLGRSTVGASAGLTNGREVLILFRWDGDSELVEDVDIVQWSDSGPVGTGNNTISPCKTGITVGASTYRDDTLPGQQEVVLPHEFGFTNSRFAYEETGETLTGGNGVTGHDETSEPYSTTWVRSSPATPGSPGPYGPPVITAAEATAVDRIRVTFSSPLDAATATEVTSFQLTLVRLASGAPLTAPVALSRAVLDASTENRVVELWTADLQPEAYYEVRITADLLSEDGRASVPAGTRVFLYGFRDSPVLVLDVPRAPYVPAVDGDLHFSYRAPQGQEVVIRILDFEGREVIHFRDESPSGGIQALYWGGRDRLGQRVRAGVYYMHMEVPGSGRRAVEPLVIGAPGSEVGR
ncbi:MAG: Ig-like domain-containing protein [Gemmatimonadetes bacterium]|nr:Ig-like domain-containing protein [Gemmatimonadota bacterium]